jgi:hypothetical protein
MLVETQLVRFDAIGIKKTCALTVGGPPCMKVSDTKAVMLDESTTVDVSVDPGALVQPLNAKVVILP